MQILGVSRHTYKRIIHAAGKILTFLKIRFTQFETQKPKQYLEKTKQIINKKELNRKSISDFIGEKKTKTKP
jgi:hypothetical protein